MYLYVYGTTCLFTYVLQLRALAKASLLNGIVRGKSSSRPFALSEGRIHCHLSLNITSMAGPPFALLCFSHARHYIGHLKPPVIMRATRMHI